MAIRWLKNVIIDGEKAVLEIQMGNLFVGDKVYTRIGSQTEKWFQNASDDREEILNQGLAHLKEQLKGKTVVLPNGTSFDWQK